MTYDNGLANRIDYLEGILHTKRNEYDSIIRPLMVWLEGKGVKFQYGCAVYDLEMDEPCNTVHGILARQDGAQTRIPVAEKDYVFVTSGSLMTNARFGDNTHIAETNRDTEDLGLFTIWRNLAGRNEKFGHPEKFLNQIDKTKWMSYFITVKDYPEFFERLERMKKFAGIEGPITERDLPKVNPLKIGELKRELLEKVSSIPPYYIMYQGRDQSVAHQESVLDPQFPKAK